MIEQGADEFMHVRIGDPMEIIDHQGDVIRKIEQLIVEGRGESSGGERISQIQESDRPAANSRGDRLDGRNDM